MNFGSQTSLLMQKILSKLPHKGDNILNQLYRSTHSLSGIFPPIVVPFEESPQQKISYQQLQKNFEIWNSWSFAGYVIHGSNGEFVNLTPGEKVELVKAVKKLMAPQKLLIAGVGCESTLATLRTSEEMAEAGANLALVVTPSYYRQHLSDQALYSYYKEVADSSPLPVILYNVPGNTGIDMNADLIVSLATHPNIIGLKDSGGDVSKLASIVFRTESANFQVIAGSASFLLPAFYIGCVGGICALANVLGSELCKLYELHFKGDQDSALKLQYRLVAPNISVTKKFGIAGLKYSMDLNGLYGGVPRRPLLPLSDANRKVLRETFKNNGF